ncbi:MAG: Dickkopf N-terminal cysteine-rich domain-containing protein, partial [Candidatus Micrarchaeia archaeon]
MKTACVYLSELSTWTQRAYKSTFWTLGAINYIQDIFGTSGPKRTFGELLNIFTLSINNVFALLLTSYIVTVAQIFLLKYIQYFALLYLIPIGVVMRSLFPFRKFGGALIGIAVALLFFLPLLLTLNAFIMDVKFDMNIEISTKCTVNENCCSHVCVNGECQTKLGIGENCISDLQCESGICHPSSKICIACKQLGDTCSAPSKCCKGLTCKEGLCVLAKNLGEQCEEHWDCQSRSCYDGKCILPGAQGSSCRRDTDCYSSKCLPDMRCAGCNLSKTEVFSVSVGGIPIVAEGGAISNIAQIDITSGFSEEGLSALWKKIMSELNKIMEVVVIAVLA